jgi:hypothetical protein
MKRLLLLLGLIGLLPAARAERHDNDRREEPRVILYQHADYQGDSLVIYPGDAIENFSSQTFSNGSGLNDNVSSIRVEGGAQVYVYENSHFRGTVMRLVESVRDLTGRLLSDNPRDNWNDRISSLKVEGSRRRPGPSREIDYDATIKRAYKELLGRNPDESGLRNYRGLMIDQGWTEQMVRDHIQQGDEFRHAGADKIIRRAYLDVLGREADPNGLNQYRKAIIEKGWTEGDVRDDLRRSAEYRNRPKSPGKP